MPLGSANALTQPLGRGMPLPGGQQPDMPQPRMTAPGSAPGGLGNRTVPAGPPTAGGIGDMPSPMGSFDGSRRTLMQQHNRNLAWQKQTTDGLNKLDKIRKGLERLADKQDMVTMDDVIDEAGKLVTHGIDPMALAGLLADAPQEGGGEALGGWVASHAQTAMLAEQRLIQAHNLAMNRTAISAMHMLMAHANGQAMMDGISPGVGKSETVDADQNGNGISLKGNGQIPAPSPGDASPQNNLAIGARFMGPQ